MARAPRADNVLLDQTALGDRGAWEELRDRYALTLYAQVFVLVGDATETEQVVAETFQQAWCSAGQYDLSGDVSAPTWLIGLARGVVLGRRARPAATPTSGPGWGAASSVPRVA
ncbi:MAG TPA: sigma factor [Gemmatimonadales bacterium]|nr:sigma factor [Gemmatimonadales bacterium]